jgi:hypothetical protein
LRFAVHRPGIPDASPRSHRMPCGDIPSCVHVSIADKTADGTREVGLALAGLLVYMSACRAALACKCGTNLLHPSGSLLLQPARKQPPPRPQDLPVQPGLGANVPSRVCDASLRRLRHLPEGEILKPDHVEAPGDVRTGLLGPIFPPISLTSRQACKCKLRATAAVRALLSARKPALQSDLALTFARCKTGHVQQLSCRQCCRNCYTAVNAYYFTITRGRDLCWESGKRDVPAAGSIESHAVRLHVVRHHARPAKTHPANFRDAHCSDMARQTANVMGPYRNNPKAFGAASFPPSRPPGRVVRIEEGHHGLTKVAQGLLLYHLGPCGEPRIFRSGFGQLATLFQVAGSTCLPEMPMRVLFNREVPDEPGMCAVVPQRRLLTGGRKQTVTRHTNMISSATDIPEEVRRRPVPDEFSVGVPRFQ